MKKLGDVLKGVASVLLLAGLVTVSVATMLGGCQKEKEVDLPFETIERADLAGTGEYYEGEEPKLFVITEAAEIDALGNTISFDAQAQLRNLDFDRYFAVAVFQGGQPDLPPPPSGIEVQGISKQGITITTYIHIYEPAEEVELRAVVASPYHLVKIRKGEDMQGEFQFILDVDGATVSQQTHRLP